jgi:hypothetical protein
MKRVALTFGLAVLALALAAPGACGLVLPPGSEGFDANVYSEGGGLAEQAGSHPGAVSFSVDFETEGGGPFTEGNLRNLSLEMPPGLIENPTALSPDAPIAAGECSQLAFSTPRSSPFEESLSGESCPDRTQVGVVTVRSSFGGGEERSFGLFNLVPPQGAPSELGFNPNGQPIVLVPSLRQADIGAHFVRRGSSSAAKKADADFRMSLARRSSRTSPRSAFSSSRSELLSSSLRLQVSASAWRTHLRGSRGGCPGRGLRGNGAAGLGDHPGTAIEQLIGYFFFRGMAWEFPSSR